MLNVAIFLIKTEILAQCLIRQSSNYTPIRHDMCISLRRQIWVAKKKANRQMYNIVIKIPRRLNYFNEPVHLYLKTNILTPILKYETDSRV